MPEQASPEHADRSADPALASGHDPVAAGRLTLGILLGVTLVGFETLAVVTIAPEIAAAFDAVERYGWIFSSFLLASLLGSVIAGTTLDRRAPHETLLAALALFGIGLACGGLAPSMTWLLIARALQGLGGGALVTALYVAVTRAYPDHRRPRVMAWMSSAWVLPALLGPTLAGAVAAAVGWRWVFLGLLPVVLVIATLTLPAFARLERGSASGHLGRRLWAATRLVLGGFFALVGLESGTLLGWTVAVASGTVALVGLRPLLPRGTLRLGRGLPSAVAARGTIYPAFVTAETMLSLMLVTHLGYSTVIAGAVLAVGSLSWTAGAWLQERLDAARGPARRGARIGLGAGLVTTGLIVQALALTSADFAIVLAVAGWAVAGLGIGMAHATSSVHVFALAGPARAGVASASLQIIDQFGAAIGTGVAGAIVAATLPTAWGAPGGIAVAMALAVVLAAAGIVAGSRSQGTHGPGDAEATSV